MAQLTVFTRNVPGSFKPKEFGQIVSVQLHSLSAYERMAFRSGQYYMNFINTLKLFTANIKSFDMKSNCTTLSSSFKIYNENQIILPNLSNYMSKGISLKRTLQVNISNINPSPSANKYVECPKI